jgi:uncharacterized membrane protein YccF (DUF307 family)
MLIVLLLASIVGALVTAAAMLLAGFGLTMALVAAPFGGSILALFTVSYLAYRRSAAPKVNAVPADRRHDAASSSAR